MTAKIYQFGGTTNEADTKDVQCKLKEVMELSESLGATGFAITLTSGGHPVAEVVAGDIARDPCLAFAATSRLMQIVR